MAFLLIGVLVSVPGTLFGAWGFHLQPPFGTIALLLGAFSLGVLLPLQFVRRLLDRASSRIILTVASALATFALLSLANSGAPNQAAYRYTSFFILGICSGALIAASFRLLQPLYEQSPSGTVSIAAGLMGIGCLCPALIGWACYQLEDFRLALYVEAGMAAAMAWIFFRMPERPELPWPRSGFRQALRELRSPVHILFAAILFFQTAAEFSVAQWTALHLSLRGGLSPGTALLYLAAYFFLLWAGRFVVQGLLSNIPHRRILLFSSALAWLGLLLLSSAENETGAALGLFLSALGYSAVYPLIVEKIGDRFSEYHASLFHGIFGLATMGGVLAPALGGWLAMEFGEVYAMRVPLAASFLVFLLLAAIWVEAKLSATGVLRS
jgi:MFS family permease